MPEFRIVSVEHLDKNANFVNRECPACGEEEMEIVIPFHPKQWQWNPFTILGEVLFGIRLIPMTFLCHSCPGDVTERMYHACLTCDALYDKRLFDGWTSFFGWTGHKCLHCGADMALERGPLAKFLLYATSPIWWIPWRMFGNRLDEWREKDFEAKAAAASVAEDGKSLYIVLSAEERNKSPYPFLAIFMCVFASAFLWSLFYYGAKVPLVRAYPIKSALVFLLIGLLFQGGFARALQEQVNEVGEHSGRRKKGESSKKGLMNKEKFKC